MSLVAETAKEEYRKAARNGDRKTMNRMLKDALFEVLIVSKDRYYAGNIALKLKRR